MYDEFLDPCGSSGYSSNQNSVVPIDRKSAGL
jgi:hypothetical protein